ncbi:Ku protein [Streptomyces sp. NPDC018833]|uniref:Ku protein n=1 Tax=Streptomyces sp. NPDC018833 TaxID=3365053 RepID=UPI00379713D6
MRATWSGVIQFGLVALPVRLYAATEEHPVRLHEIHTVDGSRVEHRRFCRAEGPTSPPRHRSRTGNWSSRSACRCCTRTAR